METVEQFFQNGTFSNHNYLTTTIQNYATSADGGVGLTGGVNARQSSQGAFTTLKLSNPGGQQRVEMMSSKMSVWFFLINAVELLIRLLAVFLHS